MDECDFGRSLCTVDECRNVKERLKELLALKRSGELDTDEKFSNLRDDFWRRDCLTYDTVESYVQYYDNEIKLNTLALIVESKKSTLRFTSKELDIIILFLRSNFKENIEFLPLIKKALKRMKGSLAVMQRQLAREEKIGKDCLDVFETAELDHGMLEQFDERFVDLKKHIATYYDAFERLRDMCICGIDATYRRIQRSLQILLLMRDLLDTEFKHITWKLTHVESLYCVMVYSTYDSIKEMAFTVIKSLDRSLLNQTDEDLVCYYVRVALDLGNTIRPIDSVTAAYILKVSMLLPGLQDVLLTEFGLPELHESVPEGIVIRLIMILLTRLKDSLILARENIVTTVTKHSLYGYLFCIRSLLQECGLESTGEERLWQDTIAELICTCFEYSRAVSSIVNNSSPEGHLPMDLNVQTVHKLCGSSPEKVAVTPQMVLLCSWRTVKEVSLLFGLLATKTPIRDDDDSSIELLNEEQIIRIGEHLVSLLTETKHRGAFEQAHVGFSQLCTRLWRLKKESLNQLPKMWLQQILVAIAGIKEDNSKLCATRRSAGVPFMIQALLVTEPRPYKDTKTATFNSVMKILLGLTQLETVNLWKNINQLMRENLVFCEYQNRSETSRNANDGTSIQVTEIKTHALNALRAIFRHSQLAEVVNDYVADGLIAAFKSYDAVTWPERNAATLLFSALIVRIFGVQRTKDHINLTTDNKMLYSSFHEKYHGSLPNLVRECDAYPAMNVNRSTAQPILLLLSRLYCSQIPEHSDYPFLYSDVYILVMQSSKSAMYETRKLAARTLAALLTEDSAKITLSSRLNAVTSGEDSIPLNTTHGTVLQIFEILKKFNFQKFESFHVEWHEFLGKTTWILKNLERGSSNPPCFPLATVYINICHEVHKVDNMYLHSHVPLLNIVVSHLVQHNTLKQGPAREDYIFSAINFVISVVKETSLLHDCVLVRMYFHSLVIPETQIIAWSTITDALNAITDTNASALLSNYAVDIIFNSIQDFHTYSPELLDAMFNFLYVTLLNTVWWKSTLKMDISKFVLDKVRLNSKKSIYCERDSYLRLLGQSYLTVASNNCSKNLDEECTDDVYNSFCDSLWIASLNTDFRKSVFRIMQGIKLHDRIPHRRLAHVQWWTTVLQLLMDNNPEVRDQASALIALIHEDGSRVNASSDLNIFLAKAHSYVGKGDPGLFCVMLFYWGVSLLDQADYEMDETDVFDKCTSYDFYEPVDTSRICAEFLKEHMWHHVQENLSDDVIDWINSRLNVQFEKSISFKTLVMDYESYNPITIPSDSHLLGPTGKSTMIRINAYKKFRNLM
ncbi:thyroid adenoma-associated protein homolog [Andrena cerasifolii]|uniref:thyroid adenoma-associated protein homolog n=1 Tax=Andrena cerasifolii TaxID=2819439 RepID=UPI0040382DEF